MTYKGYKINILLGRGGKIDPWDRDQPSVCSRKAKPGIRRIVRRRLNLWSSKESKEAANVRDRDN